MGISPKKSGDQVYLISELLLDAFNNVTFTKADLIKKDGCVVTIFPLG